ncbi:MAG: hypothetical protein WC803_12895 [Sphingomonas sp.]|jgi:hypothetical protein
MKNAKPIFVRDFSRGTIRTVQSSVVPQNSVKQSINMDSDKELGSLVSRLGTDRIGTQTVASATCKGLHYHRDTVASNHKLFGVFSDGANNNIYDVLTGSASLSGDTTGLKTRFCTYLGSTVRVNGTDACKSYNGSAWVTSGGAFDEADMPKGKVVIEWKDRIYTAIHDILYYSTVADPDARTISWTITADDADSAGQIEMEQEDGGGDITALEKVPGYLLVFKERAMKRWDGSSTYPEDLVNIGAPSQEAVCRGRGMVFIANQEGLWATNGGYPKKMSKPVQDLWDAIPAANLPSIATVCDETYVYVYVGDITIGDNVLTNVCFKFNIDSQSFDVYSYYDDFTVFAWYISSSQKVIIAGNKNGEAIQINTGNTDYASTPQPITWSVETQDMEFGGRRSIKEVIRTVVLTKNVRTGVFMVRSDSDRDKDWKTVCNIVSDVEDVDTVKALGHWFNFKTTGVTDTGQVTFLGFEFPEQSVNISLNV